MPERQDFVDNGKGEKHYIPKLGSRFQEEMVSACLSLVERAGVLGGVGGKSNQIVGTTFNWREIFSNAIGGKNSALHCCAICFRFNRNLRFQLPLVETNRPKQAQELNVQFLSNKKIIDAKPVSHRTI